MKNVFIVLLSLASVYLGVAACAPSSEKPASKTSVVSASSPVSGTKQSAVAAPVAVATKGDFAEIHCKHFFYGYPTGAPKTNDLIIRDIYALSSNDGSKIADWVCYRLTKDEVLGQSEGKRAWKPDPWLADEETFEPADYKGANKELKVDRGHQAPLASFKGTEDAFETNYLSNITPQKAELNQGPWRILEDKVRKIVEGGNDVHVMTGPLFERDMGRMPGANEDHIIPSGYWKIVVIHESSKSFAVAGFIFEQETGRREPILPHLVTVDEIEKRSGLDFFRELDDKEENAAESRDHKDKVSKYFD